MKLKLVDDWKKSPKWWSMRLSALLTVLSVLQGILGLWEMALPSGTFAVLAAVLGSAIMIARNIKQAIEETDNG